MLELIEACVDRQAEKRLLHRSMDDAAFREAVGLLERRDREMLAMWGSGQVSMNAIAGLLRCHRATVYRRVRRIQRRLNRPVVLMIASAWREMPRAWRNVAIAVHIRAERRAHVAQRLGLCRREVNEILAGIDGWVHARRFGGQQGENTQE